MTAVPTLIAVGPYDRTALASRPARLVAELVRVLEPPRTVLVTRVRPGRFVRAVRSGGLGLVGAWPAATAVVSQPGPADDAPGPGPASAASPRTDLVLYPWPFGFAERRFLDALLRRELAARPDAPVVVIVSDPKSADSLRRDTTNTSRRVVRVFDAYDAWDLSPLVQGRRRQDAVRRGYRDAAASADLVIANTAFMVDRMRDLGARDVRIVANGAPAIVDTVAVASPPYLAYVGRIHERVDCALLAAVAGAFPDVQLRLAGPIEGRPDGWDALVARPNVRVEGALETGAAREFIAASAALLVPHVPSDYTRSQDAMKAWDALASGTPVVSTGVPPVVDWPSDIGVAAADIPAFVSAVADVLSGEPTDRRARRLAMARANDWASRARALADAINERLAP